MRPPAAKSARKESRVIRMANVAVLVVLLLAGSGCMLGAAPEEPAAENEGAEPVLPTREVTEAAPGPTGQAGEHEDEEPGIEPGSEVEKPEEEDLVSMAEVERQVRAHLAERLDIPEEQIQTTAVEERTWLDDSFECSSRRIAGESGPIPGYRIVLSVGDETFDYRADRQGQFRLCPDEEDIGKPLGPIQ